MSRWQKVRQMVGAAILLLESGADSFVRGRLALALLAGLGFSVLSGASPVLLKLAVDSLAASRVDSYFLPVALAVGYAASQWLARALQELQWLTYGGADHRLERQMSLRLFAHVMSLPLRFHLDRITGAIAQTLANGLHGFRLIVQHLVFSVLPVIVEVATMTGILIYLGHTIFLAIIGTSVACYTAAFAMGAVHLGKAAGAASAATVHANGLLTDGLLNYEAVKCLNAEATIQGQFDAALAATEGYWKHFYIRKLENGLLVTTIFALSLGTTLVVAAHAVSSGELTIGEFVLVHAYLLQLVRPLEMAGFAVRDSAQGFAFIEKMMDLMNEHPEDEARTPTSRRVISQMAIEFEDVSFSYRAGKQIISDVSFSVAPGTTVAVVGPSGSGKSSLVRLLLRFCEPDSGVISLDDIPLSEFSVVDLRNIIAVVPQDTALFNESIAYNIGIARPGCIRKDIAQAARIAHLHGFISAQSEGYETKVGERGIKLSGGERQRIAIARAVLRHPRIFVFDEATSSLDSITEQKIVRNIGEFSRDITTLIVAHRLSTVVDADEIVVLDTGRVIERGSHYELLGARGTYASMWAAQQRRFPEA